MDAGTMDAGTEDAGTMDAGADFGTDAGRPLEGVCAAALADVPLGLVAVRFVDGEVRGLGADGEQGLVYRPFTDGGVRGEVVQRGIVASAGSVAGVMVAERACSRAPCGRRGELFVVTPEGVMTFDVSSPTPERDPGLNFVTEDGLAVVSIPRSASFSDTRVEAIDTMTGTRTPLRARISSLERQNADAEGWRLARIGDEAAPGYVHLERGEIEVAETVSPRPIAFRGAWVSFDEAGVYLEGRTERTTIPLPPGLELTHLGSVFSGAPELRRANAIVGVVDLVRARAHVFDEAIEGGMDRNAQAVVEGDTVLVSEGGLPRLLLDLATGEVRSVRERVPATHEEVSAHYCTPPARPVGDGLLVALRSDAHTGAFRVGEGTLAPLGRPVRDVSWVSFVTAGETVVIVGNTGRLTFCPNVEPTDDPPVGEELVGDSTQLVSPDGTVRTLTPETGLAYLDPLGRCALQVPLSWPGTYALLDLVTGDEVSWEGEGAWWPLVNVPVPLFF